MMQRHTKLAAAGMASLGVACVLYGLAQAVESKPAPKVASPPAITVTATVLACAYQDGKADSHCTPGAINPEVTQDNIHQTICVKGWTKTIRPPASYTDNLKSIQLQRYGQSQQPKLYEEDHLIALELGGAPRNSDNLWPQSWNGPTGAHAKDSEENQLHAQVCAPVNPMPLSVAQQTIVRDWTH
ncbi:MAG TPA: hypothetical protein VFX61_14605 [Micromonosporaceae bacterium]|nr:hypothetical protein [Micromonosporaceae bacterium]